MNKRSVGTNYEKLAEAYLKKHGVKIVRRNFRVRAGEIDLIGYDGNTLVFFEVKYRRSDACGLPQEAVTYQKQKQICRIADCFCCFYPVKDDISMRFDVVAIMRETMKSEGCERIAEAASVEQTKQDRVANEEKSRQEINRIEGVEKGGQLQIEWIKNAFAYVGQR